MHKCAVVENEMPSFLRCKGLNYEETKHLNMQDVSMFIERDLHYYLKKLTELKPTFAISLIKRGEVFEIRVHVNVAFANASEPLRRRIEALLWQYNSQTFVQKQGQLIALPARFQFDIEVSEHEAKPSVEAVEVQNDEEGANHA